MSVFLLLLRQEPGYAEWTKRSFVKEEKNMELPGIHDFFFF